MEAEGLAEAASGSVPACRASAEEGEVRVRRATLQAVLEQCQRALELLKNADADAHEYESEGKVEEESCETNSPSALDRETDELCDLLKSKVESPNFLEKLGSIHMLGCHNLYDNASWDVVSSADIWEDNNGNSESDSDDYVFVRQEDIVEGIACFMAAYLLSLKHAKELTPNQLQEALSKTFSLKKKKSKLRKAWDGSKVIYNVASWGATAVGYCGLLELLPCHIEAILNNSGVLHDAFRVGIVQFLHFQSIDELLL